MNLIYLIEIESKFEDMMTRSLSSLSSEEKSELISFDSFNSLNEAVNEKIPDLLMINEDIFKLVDEKLVNDLLAKMHDNLVDNILLSSAETREASLYFDSSINMLDTTSFIHHALQRHLARKNIANREAKRLQDAMSLTTKSLELAGDLGEIQQVYYTFSSLKTIDDLISLILEIINNYQVNVVLLVNFKGQEKFYSNSEGLSELDTEIVKSKKSDERFVEFGVRTQVNYSSIAALIKNMPKKNTEKYTRIKDNMVYLLSACDTLIQLYELFNKESQITDKISQTSEIIKDMTEQAYESQINIMNEIVLQIEDTFYSLSLSETQETEMLKILKNAETKTEHLQFLTSAMLKILDELKTDSQKVVTIN